MLMEILNYFRLYPYSKYLTDQMINDGNYAVKNDFVKLNEFILIRFYPHFDLELTIQNVIKIIGLVKIQSFASKLLCM